MSSTSKNILASFILITHASFATPSETHTARLNSLDSSKNIHLIIENKNKKAVSLLIKPQVPTDSKEIPIFPKKLGWLALTIPGASDEMQSMDSEFIIPAEELGKSQSYSLTGETNLLTPTGTCYDLHPGKCYKITFTNNILGTDCISSEIKGTIPHITGRPVLIPSRKAIPGTPRHTPLQPERPSDVLTSREKLSKDSDYSLNSQK